MQARRVYFLTLCLILSLILQQVSGSPLLPFTTLANKYPSHKYIAGPMTASDTIKVVITWTGGAAFVTAPFLYKIINGVETTTSLTLASGEKNQTTSYLIAEKTAGFDGSLAIYIKFVTVKVVPYNLQFFVNGVLILN